MIDQRKIAAPLEEKEVNEHYAQLCEKLISEYFNNSPEARFGNFMDILLQKAEIYQSEDVYLKPILDLVQNEKFSFLMKQALINRIGGEYLKPGMDYLPNIISKAEHARSQQELIILCSYLKALGKNCLKFSSNEFMKRYQKSDWIFLGEILKLAGINTVDMSVCWFHPNIFKDVTFPSVILHNKTEKYSVEDWDAFGAFLKRAGVVSLDISNSDFGRLSDEIITAMCKAFKESGVSTLNLTRTDLSFEKLKKIISATDVIELKFDEKRLTSDQVNELTKLVELNKYASASDFVKDPNKKLVDLIRFTIFKKWNAEIQEIKLPYKKKPKSLYFLVSDDFDENMKLEKEVIHQLKR